MDFFRRVFNKSGSNPDLTPLESSNDSSLFGGLEVNELDQNEDATPLSDPIQSPEGEKSGYVYSFIFFPGYLPPITDSNPIPRTKTI